MSFNLGFQRNIPWTSNESSLTLWRSHWKFFQFHLKSSQHTVYYLPSRDFTFLPHKKSWLEVVTSWDTVYQNLSRNMMPKIFRMYCQWIKHITITKSNIVMKYLKYSEQNKKTMKKDRFHKKNLQVLLNKLGLQ